MAGFAELGIEGTLEESLRAIGYEAPTPLQRAAIPVLRRGGNAVLLGSTGAGLTGAYGIPLIERISNESIKHALVVVASVERAADVAAELARLGSGVNVGVGAFAAEWTDDAWPITVVPAPSVMDLLGESRLKLDNVDALVIEGASAIQSTGNGELLETLLANVPKDGQRIIATIELTPEIDRLVDAHVRRALHIPARPAVPEQDAEPKEPIGRVRYTIARETEKLRTLALLLRQRGEGVRVYTRSRQRATQLATDLSMRHITADVHSYEDAVGKGPAVAYDVPFDADALSTLIGDGGAVLIEAKEVPHFRRIATQARLTIVPVPPPPTASEQVQAFREIIRRAARDEDIESQMLVIAPLLEEFTAAEIAAAAIALLRKRTPITERGARGAPQTFVKLFLSIGEKDAISAREIVGAITGESGIEGSQIGRVDVRDAFSIVEVESDVAERVIRSMNGTSLRGRSLRVDYDRKPAGGMRRAGPPRGAEGGRERPTRRLQRGEGPSRPRGEGPSRPRGEGPSRPRGEGPSRPRGEGPSRPRGEGPPRPRRRPE